MTDLHKNGEASVESHGQAPADGVETTEGVTVPPVGTLPTQETSETDSGVADTGTTRLIDWVSKHRPEHDQAWLMRGGGCKPTPERAMGCLLPRPLSHEEALDDERVTWDCPDCHWTWQLNPIVKKWFRLVPGGAR